MNTSYVLYALLQLHHYLVLSPIGLFCFREKGQKHYESIKHRVVCFKQQQCRWAFIEQTVAGQKLRVQSATSVPSGVCTDSHKLQGPLTSHQLCRKS